MARIRTESHKGRGAEWFAVAWVRHGQLKRLDEYQRERDAQRALREDGSS